MLNRIRQQYGIGVVPILIVIVVVIAAAAVFAPRMLQQGERAKRAQAAEDIEKLGIALDSYAKDNGDYPSTAQGLKSLWQRPSEPPTPINWVGSYIDSPITDDPWDNPYIYIRPGKQDLYRYDLISYGSDGKPGGQGSAEDVTNSIRLNQ